MEQEIRQMSDEELAAAQRDARRQAEAALARLAGLGAFLYLANEVRRERERRDHCRDLTSLEQLQAVAT